MGDEKRFICIGTRVVVRCLDGCLSTDVLSCLLSYAQTPHHKNNADHVLATTIHISSLHWSTCHEIYVSIVRIVYVQPQRV